MKTPKIRLVFDRKNTADEWKSKKRSKMGLLQLELYYDGKRKWYTTGISLYKGQWDDTKRVVNHPDCIELNSRISTIMNRANRNLSAQIEKGEFSVSEFDKVFAFESVSETSLLDAVTEMEETYKKLGKSYSAIMQYSALRTKLDEYNDDPSVTLKLHKAEDATLDAIESFDVWMHSVIHLNDSTAWLYHCKLKHVIRAYIKKHKGLQNPYDDFELEKPTGEKLKYLTEEEIKKVEQLELKKDNRRYVRDLFLFQRYTGLSFADVIAIRKELDVEIVDGKAVLRKERIKTGVNFAIVLLPQALEILDRYGGRLDKYRLQNVNILLHEIGLMAIGKKLTSHIARHSFATYALSKGVPLEYVSKMLGHTNVITTQRYAKVLAEDVLAQFDKL